MRKKNSVEKIFEDMPSEKQVIASILGRAGLKAWDSGVLEIARWVQAMAECRKLHPGISNAACKRHLAQLHGDYERELRELIDDAALSRDVSKIRQLASVLELPKETHDPLRLELLSIKLTGSPLALATDKVDVGAKVLTATQLAEKTGATVRQVRLLAKKLDVRLTPGKKGPHKATRKKVLHRARC
jgi:hypothetical protein